MSIYKSVGIGGSNLRSDVSTIVRLLNRNRHLLMPHPDLAEDGEYSDVVGDRILLFQRRVLTSIATHEGTVEPGSQTLDLLQTNARSITSEDVILPLFPFTVRPKASYLTHGRAFRAMRSTARLHAACDLLFPAGTPIRAMREGKVIQKSYPFYEGTYALEIDHGTFIARYGEIAPGSVPTNIDREGATVSRGDVIASVGILNSGSSMLHLELYSGVATGALSIRSSSPFQRRQDLLDPTDFLDIALLEDLADPKDAHSDLATREPGVGESYVVTDDAESGLRIRAEPSANAEVLFRIGPGTLVTLRGIRNGGPYTFKDHELSGWAAVEYLNTSGYVAAAYIARAGHQGHAGAARPTKLNQILFDYEPTGAADHTARQDGLPERGIHGVAASEAMAETDRGRVEQLKAKFVAAGEAENLPPALLGAIASRESRCGNALSGGGYGDGGHGFGIMQIDDRSWSAETGEGPKGLAHIRQAAGILAGKLRSTQNVRGVGEALSLLTATSRYNGGSGLPAPNSDRGTTGGDYGNDVWARARYYARKIDWT